MLIILSQKTDTESQYLDRLFEVYNFPASLRKYIHEGDTFIYNQGDRHVKEHRYYFGTGRIGKITPAEDGSFDAELQNVKRFKKIVPIYYSEEKGSYIEGLDYETVREKKTPPWRTSIRPLSQKAFDCIISRAGALLEVKKEESVDELKEKLKGAIRHFYFGDDQAIRDIVDIATAIRGELFPKENILSQGNSIGMHEQSVPLTIEEQSFLDYCRTTKMSYSYKMLLILSFMTYADKKGNMKIDDAVKYFRGFFNDRREKGLIIEKKPCIYHDVNVTDIQIRNNLIANPVKALVGSGFFIWDRNSGLLEMIATVWNSMSKGYTDKVKYVCENRLKEYFKNG